MNETLHVCVKYWMLTDGNARRLNPERLTRDGLAEAIKQLNEEIERLNLLIPVCGE